ncbi:pyridoxamine 5'-phosphate oxidase family protein [Maritimibacter sp. UBA3975]|uniref:pyridoxamine 5'-phosphate oxidase family protein n=1 Tax=Maritimibacter sp. UBA3975 TaxID=1946833 RepID=UPI000C0B6E83|nr:pyridoxamine 5'-phosphate oxidase family protein [Maritimibacter sp. UBA3975]MAM61949.1 pyridoxamine 5'-phosphate oxidase [Maritimibacter sp.]|tara:strand:+ start:18106 stop:18711 length:606 start_codon:yes stop_codon:yes gene_type:complete
MKRIETVEALEALYPTKPSTAATIKVTDRLIPGYRSWIAASRFCILSTVGPEGTDASPRGDDGPVALTLDDRLLAIPDWKGNNRLDTLRNIVRDGRVSVMFMVPGSMNVMRVNGTAILTDDPHMTGRFDRAARVPKSVILVTVGEVYPQCARAILRAGLWSRDDAAGLPTMGEMLTQASEGDFDGAGYDIEWPDRAKDTMW